ncbi:MAG: M48 family metalloprotease [Sphingomonadaceae bacterium]|nr:M48 family metalloprotease [Sphingomonadaceae bacterium]
MTGWSRRGVLAGATALCCAAPAAARVAPATMLPLVDPGYRPSDATEGALWQHWGRFEQDLAASPALLHAPDLHDYVSGVLANLLGPRARDVRLYIVHDASFNASMAPNGLTIVQTGLLARMRSEAQLAAVLGHEAGHYLRLHAISREHDVVHKNSVMAFVSVGSGLMAGVAAVNGVDGRGWIDLSNSVNAQLYASLFGFRREQEAEADAFGLRLMAEAGYTPDAAAAVWQQQLEEAQASAAARSKHYRPRASILDSHPPDAVRMADLTLSAREVVVRPAPGRDGRAEYRRAIAPYRAMLLDEQIRVNDPGASLYLLNALAADGWDGTLRFYEGEAYRLRGAPGDDALEAQAFAAATERPDAPPAAWRAHGYALIKAGRADDGKQALARYLALAPTATDAAMVRFALAQ